MIYPEMYSLIPEEEMEYLVGGSVDYKGAFDYLLGNYLRDQVLYDVRTAIWKSAKQGSLAPLASWYETVSDYSLVGVVGFLYGAFRVYETVSGYFKDDDD